MRLSMMAMSGCSISFSDDLRLLDLPRIRMMQQCLPPEIRPPGRSISSTANCPRSGISTARTRPASWEAVGVFNFDEQPRAAHRRSSRPSGCPPATEAVAFEFWEEKFMGVHKRPADADPGPAYRSHRLDPLSAEPTRT